MGNMDDHTGGWLWLIAGILFLLADLGVFDWGISWWTVVFIVMGLGAFMKK